MSSKVVKAIVTAASAIVGIMVVAKCRLATASHRVFGTLLFYDARSGEVNWFNIVFIVCIGVVIAFVKMREGKNAAREEKNSADERELKNSSGGERGEMRSSPNTVISTNGSDSKW